MININQQAIQNPENAIKPLEMNKKSVIVSDNFLQTSFSSYVLLSFFF